MSLTFEQLENQNVKCELIQPSFEYMLAEIVKRYSEENNIKTLDEFNKKNDITRTKLSVFPFFVSTANGHTHSLFNLFGKFRAEIEGPISEEINNSILNNDSEYFLYEKNMNLQLKSKLEVTEIKDLMKLVIYEINNKEVTLFGERMKFEDVEIEKDIKEYNKLYKGILSGIESLEKYSNYSFFNLNIIQIEKNSKKFTAYIRKVKNEDNTMIYNEIEEDKKRNLLPY